MSNLTPHQAAALSTIGHMALTANAGSGKTFVLARKYLDALLKENLDISSVAAITFTEKAASELYQKISLLIEDRINENPDLPAKKHLEKIRRQLVSANISTIHSFCISVLREYPVEADLDARFIPIDENLSDELIELSAEEMIRSSFDNELVNEDLKYLIRIFSSKSKLQSQIVSLIKNRKNVFTVKEKIYSLDEKEISEFFFNEFSGNFLKIWDKYKPQLIENLFEINNAVIKADSKNAAVIEIESKLKRLKTESEITSIIKILSEIKVSAFTKSLSIRKQGYLKGESAESLSNEIRVVENLMKNIDAFQISEDHRQIEFELARFGKTLLAFFDYALDIYDGKKKSEGFIDYEDILLHTKLLLENDNVQKLISAKYKFILVDEFQDTNEIQYQIFLPILDYLKGGNLFIVGDEKQSIYKFRDAEIEIFNLTRSDIKKAVGAGNLLILPDSFRMTPAICTFCNYLFKNLFSDPDESLDEVPATDLVCARNDDKSGHVEFLVSKNYDKNVTDSEAELAAKKILHLIQKSNYSFNDIAILVRKRKYFSELEKMFLKYDIPFTIVGGKGFYQRQTISDVYNYLSFLVDENNNTALVGILRSPFFSIPDSKLFAISLNKGKSFWRKLNSVKNDLEVTKICELLNENISISSSVSLPDLIHKIITDRNFISILSSRVDSEQEIANLNKLVSIARNFNSVGFRNLYDFLAFIKDSISNLADESQASISSNTNAVQLMTIHQSKGLEFPIVFLYKTDEAGMSNAIKSGEVRVDKKFGLLTKVPVDQNYFEEYQTAPIAAMYNYFEDKKNNAELKRLLYVAVTRAKDELYITTSIKKEGDFKKDSFINLLAAGLKIDFSESEIFLNSELDFLKIKNDKYVNIKEKIDLKIPIITDIDIEFEKKEKSIRDTDDVEINTSSLHSQEKGEIISASKVSIYDQCPLKYLLTYEYGFGKFNSDYLSFRFSDKNKKDKKISEFEDHDEKDDLRFESFETKIIDYDPALYGRLFHKCMEKSVKPEHLDHFISNELGLINQNEAVSKKLLHRLRNDLEYFYRSALFLTISNKENYKNEFEIYVADKDYFLHGIIDKIIFEKNKISIYDYKTDDIEIKEIKKHSVYYLMQLKFYLYIASKLFSEFDIFEGSLVFVKYPDNPVTLSYNKSNLQKLESEITNIIKSIRKKNSDKNLNHCKVCSYSGFTNKCIIS